MRALFILALASLPFLAHGQTSRRILDCNFNFDYIAQIQIFDEGRGELSYRLLTNTGRWLDKQPLPSAQWEAKDIRFEARGRYFDGGFYRFHSRNGGRSWAYEVRSHADASPGTIGGADCD